MTTRVAALIAAAGSGKRLGRGPKALVRVGGSTLLDLALRALTPLVDEVIVAVPPGRAIDFPQRPGVRYVSGGVTRQDSVRAMLAETVAGHVLVHDVARPFLTPDVVERVLEAARASGAATAALAVHDTVVTTEGEELDRSRLLSVQTPQGFDTLLLRKAHEAAAASGAAATDDAGLVRRLGHHVEMVEGSPLLLKVTRPEDLLVAEALSGLLRQASG